MLTACTKEETAVQTTEVTQAVASPTAIPTQEVTPTEPEAALESDPNEKPYDVEVKDFKEETVHNEFFSASLTEYDPAANDEDMTTLVFEFTNITDKTYYKNDEEIVSGGTWEKTITYHGDKWAGMAGQDCWIHYDLYEDYENQKQIYKGGLRFTINENLEIVDIDTFED